MPNPPNEGAFPVHNVGQLLTNALQDGGIIGIDEDLEDAVLNKAFFYANWLLSDWETKRWLVYSITDYAIVSTGAQTYGVGLGQPVNISPRPDRLEYAYVRFLATAPPQFPVDIQLDIIQSKEDYSRIPVKNIGTLPWRIFYDPQWTIGLLYPWPVPQASLYELHVGFKTVLPRFTAINQSIMLPPMYEAAMNWCLAGTFREAFQLPESPGVTKRARTALNAIRLANQAVGTLRMPAFLRNRNRGYDYRGDSDSW